MPRHDSRRPNQLRSFKIRRRYTRSPPGSVLVEAGKTVVLCTASVEPNVPRWLEGKGKGWVTAEYNMLPGSTNPRKARRSDGRSTEIQRLIGRSLRGVVDLEALGEQMITVDCDVLDADGGTRTASISGALVALVDAIRSILRDLPDPKRYPLLDSVAAVSCGIVDKKPILDLDYREDHDASVDMNVVMTGSGKFIEIQGTGEESTFDDTQLSDLLTLARRGISELTSAQKKSLGKQWPF